MRFLLSAIFFASTYFAHAVYDTQPFRGVDSAMRAFIAAKDKLKIGIEAYNAKSGARAANDPTDAEVLAEHDAIWNPLDKAREALRNVQDFFDDEQNLESRAHGALADSFQEFRNEVLYNGYSLRDAQNLSDAEARRQEQLSEHIEATKGFLKQGLPLPIKDLDAMLLSELLAAHEADLNRIEDSQT